MNSSLLLAALLACIHVPFSEASENVLDNAFKVCGNGVNFKKEDILKLFEEKFQNPASPDKKCFIKCVMQSEGWMTEDGEIPVTPLIANYEKCTTVGDDACDRAFLFHKCVYDNNGDELFVKAFD